MTSYHFQVPSPVGQLTLTSDGTALTGLSFGGDNWDPQVPEDSVESKGHFKEVITQLDEYFNGKRQTFELTLKPSGTQFQLEVWEALRKIPYGTTTSYGELARSMGKPNAFRAVGLANGKNPIAIIVPCHRVIGANGKLVGFGGGLGNKAILLDLESQSEQLSLV